MRDLSLSVLEEFAEAQSWVHAAIAAAELRHEARLREQRARAVAARQQKLATDATARARFAASQEKYERTRWAAVRSDPARRAAHNARRMRAHYRAKARKAGT